MDSFNAITFSFNLATVDRDKSSLPYDITEAYMASTRSTFIPDLLNNNYVKRDGETFTVYGRRAVYLRDNYSDQALTAEARRNASLTVVLAGITPTDYREAHDVLGTLLFKGSATVVSE